jgi:hypothetical protein
VTLIVVRTDNNFSENGREQDKAWRSWYSSSGEDNEQLQRRNSSSDGALGCQVMRSIRVVGVGQQFKAYMIQLPRTGWSLVPSTAIKQQCSYTKKLRDPWGGHPSVQESGKPTKWQLVLVAPIEITDYAKAGNSSSKPTYCNREWATNAINEKWGKFRKKHFQLQKAQGKRVSVTHTIDVADNMLCSWLLFDWCITCGDIACKF